MGRLPASVPRTRLFTDPYFEAAAIPLCSGLRVCLPPRSFLPLQVPPAGQPRLLRPSRTRVDTFARIGYAIGPTTGNWPNEDFHLARFTALSTAPLKRGVQPIEVCHKCAVRFGPICAKVLRFNTRSRRFRAGLVMSKLLICNGETKNCHLPALPTLNQ